MPVLYTASLVKNGAFIRQDTRHAGSMDCKQMLRKQRRHYKTTAMNVNSLQAQHQQDSGVLRCNVMHATATASVLLKIYCGACC